MVCARLVFRGTKTTKEEQFFFVFVFRVCYLECGILGLFVFSDDDDRREEMWSVGGTKNGEQSFVN